MPLFTLRKELTGGICGDFKATLALAFSKYILTIHVSVIGKTEFTVLALLA